MSSQPGVLKRGVYAGEIVRYSANSAIMASLTTFRPQGLNKAWHAHSNPMLCFVLKGCTQEKKKNLYDCRPGQLIHYAAGEYHQIVDSLPEAAYVNFEIEPGFLEENNCSGKALQTVSIPHADTKFLMIRIAKELLFNDADSGSSIELLLLDLLDRRASGPAGFIAPAWLNNIKELLNDHWNDPLSLDDLSAAAGVHRVTISKKFHQFFGCSLGEYRRRLKVDRALSLIGSCSNLTELAYTCGFFDQSHFTRAFKELTGFRPHAFWKIQAANPVLF